MKELKIFAASLFVTALLLIAAGLTARLLWESIKLGWHVVDLVL